jgi:hypothetical protein
LHFDMNWRVLRDWTHQNLAIQNAPRNGTTDGTSSLHGAIYIFCQAYERENPALDFLTTYPMDYDRVGKNEYSRRDVQCLPLQI